MVAKSVRYNPCSRANFDRMDAGLDVAGTRRYLTRLMASDRLVDKRIVERNISKGLLSESEYQKYLTALPDVASKAEMVDYGVDAEIDDEDDDED